MALEINLVPDVKNEMIKTLKLRNLIFFICIVVAGASVAVSLIFWSISAGQQAIANGKKDTLGLLTEKVNSYSDLSDFLTVKDQLSNLSSIDDNKKVLSRTFGILSALLPSGPDTIQISALNINLSADNPTFTFDAQADAHSEPYIDYNVLDAFKKSMQYMRYDYGDYVDKNGDTIPAYCIIESGTDGATFYDTDRSSYYAYWLIRGEGCNPAADDDNSSDTETSVEEGTEEIITTVSGYAVEDYNGQTVVRIWRTPQFNDWYHSDSRRDEPEITLDGQISNVPHFESSCISYSGTENTDNSVEWASENNCLLVPDGIDGITIADSSNGRGAGDELVLRFNATITLNPEIYKFTNHHMLALAPLGRRNVTDSFVQIQNMFAERASDCAEGDTACKANNNGGSN